MKAYQDIVRHVLEKGRMRPNRTATKTLGVFGGTFTHDLQEGFPLLTTKKMNLAPIVAELVGFIRGVTNAGEFRALGCKIWDANANENLQWRANPNRTGEDDLGRIYGAQWRDWRGPVTYLGPHDEDGWEYAKIDQLQNLIDGIKADPYGRRHIVTAWNPGELSQMALPPCHMFFQCNVRDGYLDLQMYQRSADVFLGVSFNVASYAALTHVLAELTDLKPGVLSICFGDLHIYEDHIEQCKVQIAREPLELPELTVNHIESLDEVAPHIFHLHAYECHDALKGKMAV